MAKDRHIKSARVAGWEYDLIQEKNGRYIVLSYDLDGCPYDEEYCFDVTCDRAAKIAFDGLVHSLREESEPEGPNWEAQAEYDELHGTVNGQDPGVLEMMELWGE